MEITVVNLEKGMPRVEQAQINFDQALRTARARKTKVLKIIHGYGSTGKGGAIKKSVHTVLRSKKAAGAVKHYIPGENFTPFDDNCRKVLSIYPFLSKDSDYSRTNPGITIVIL